MERTIQESVLDELFESAVFHTGQKYLRVRDQAEPSFMWVSKRNGWELYINDLASTNPYFARIGGSDADLYTLATRTCQEIADRVRGGGLGADELPHIVVLLHFAIASESDDFAGFAEFALHKLAESDIAEGNSYGALPWLQEAKAFGGRAKLRNYNERVIESEIADVAAQVYEVFESAVPKWGPFDDLGPSIGIGELLERFETFNNANGFSYVATISEDSCIDFSRDPANPLKFRRAISGEWSIERGGTEPTSIAVCESSFPEFVASVYLYLALDGLSVIQARSGTDETATSDAAEFVLRRLAVQYPAYFGGLTLRLFEMLLAWWLAASVKLLFDSAKDPVVLGDEEISATLLATIGEFGRRFPDSPLSSKLDLFGTLLSVAPLIADISEDD